MMFQHFFPASIVVSRPTFSFVRNIYSVLLVRSFQNSRYIKHTHYRLNSLIHVPLVKSLRLMETYKVKSAYVNLGFNYRLVRDDY